MLLSQVTSHFSYVPGMAIVPAGGVATLGDVAVCDLWGCRRANGLIPALLARHKLGCMMPSGPEVC